MNYLFVLLVFSIIASCINAKSRTDQQPQHPLVGEWVNTYLRVDMHTYKNSDTTRIMEADESNWEQKLKAKTIHSFYRADGSYNSVHRNLKDSIVYNPAGVWSTKADSLYMTDTFPKHGIKYVYKYKINKSIAEFWGTEDFDQDGKIDDTYYGRQRRL